MGGLFLCIHGHFYQPPRENPWTGKIEVQPTAAPFHDWNERIFQECYKPNTEAVIIDDAGKVLRRVNNYEYLNFNFGPALFDWISENHPNTYTKIIEADKISVQNHNGHGNAIAQVYNHLIMPLAMRRDKITQVKWGIADFELRFGRKPEGMWLAETACNNATLEVLIGEGIRYTILDPSQALKVRKLNTDRKFLWEDVSDGRINTRMPYRFQSKEKNGEFIDIFFYDGPLSKGIAFDDVVFDSKRLMDKIDSANMKNFEYDQLISMAVDGETFGHHKHFTERTIAYLLSEYALTRGYKVVNYAEYLERSQAEYEVMLNEGPKGEGTAWSCIHGVGRWKENCGCYTGGAQGWNQQWRSPLRNALNQLNFKLGVLFELEGRKYLKDPWTARNEYINVILEKTGTREESFSKFLSGMFLKRLKQSEKITCINLLEMQKYSMLMFTSCGWFFADISGIETQKIIEYAKRAIELGETISGVNLEQDFLDELSKAKSNKRNEIPTDGENKELSADESFINGADIYKSLGDIR
ncbi:MAG: DUF3536 domain-containing protein [Ignavibacteriae bacterium]|nr:DUF3536 domain-containing protein [Ignavibacteriota bacterium]